jgi:A/G-specific adenine glycosylase
MYLILNLLQIFYSVIVQKIGPKLLNWHKKHNNRQLPWKNESDIYKIWLSEVLLQQTRALQAIPYYQKFIAAYPTLASIAKAEDNAVFSLWQGLGYYNRCKNMLATARHIYFNLNGNWPNSYQGLLELKGIGNYTASAIASFAYNANVAVLDGNVYRILSRYFANNTPIDTTLGKKTFTLLAQNELPFGKAKLYNQAIMDFGATICTPKQALCTICPLQKTCGAYLANTIYNYPVKTKKIERKNRYFHYLFITNNKHIYIKPRLAKDIWQNLYEFALVETATSKPKWPTNLPKPNQLLSTYKQTLTHQNIHTFFYNLPFKQATDWIIKERLIKVPIPNLSKYGFPKSMVQFLQEFVHTPA